MTGDAALAEDLAQDTFVKAFRSLGSFDPARRLSSWLLRIAHNTAIDAMRRQRLQVVPIETANRYDFYKDGLRTDEILARQRR